jgi:hypothetical protein
MEDASEIFYVKLHIRSYFAIQYQPPYSYDLTF